jgi:predicted peptidase
MHKPIAFLSALMLAVIASGCSTIQSDPNIDTVSAQPAMQTPQRFKKRMTHTAQLDYLLFLPAGYKARGEKWPLMMFLHGVGESGTNLNKVAIHGPPKLVKGGKTDLPFVLVSPQCPADRVWRDDELLALLDEVIAKHNVDTNRVYLTGLSMGGYGTWSLGTRNPERFAAIAPVCGGGDQIPILLANPRKKAALKSMGVWAFHGGKDSLVILEESQRMTNALMRAGCKDVKLTVYPEAGHDSWTQAYQEAELWNWFLAHKRAR